MKFKKWMDKEIRDSWHSSEFRNGIEENRLEMEKELGKKLSDIPVVAELKAEDRKSKIQGKVSNKSDARIEIRA